MSTMQRRRSHSSTDLGRRFLYCRYNVDLSGKGLAALGFPKADPAGIRKMDAVKEHSCTDRDWYRCRTTG